MIAYNLPPPGLDGLIRTSQARWAATINAARIAKSASPSDNFHADRIQQAYLSARASIMMKDYDAAKAELAKVGAHLHQLSPGYFGRPSGSIRKADAAFDAKFEEAVERLRARANR